MSWFALINIINMGLIVSEIVPENPQNGMEETAKVHVISCRELADDPDWFLIVTI